MVLFNIQQMIHAIIRELDRFDFFGYFPFVKAQFLIMLCK